MSVTLVLGDPHIGKGMAIGKPGIGTSLNSRIVDQINILDWTLDQAIDNNVLDIIITGDIFDDPKPPPGVIAILFSWLKKCESYNIRVHIVFGNHDILRSGAFTISALDIISEADINGIFVYKSNSTIYTEGACFTLMPFRDRRSFNCDSNIAAIDLLKQSISYELSEIPNNYFKVLIGHFALAGSIPIGDEIDDIANELFCPLDMFNGYDYVWMGHVHKPQVMSKSPYIAHIGSMDLSDFGETDHKKIIILFDTDSNEVFKQIEIPTRPLRKISISIPENTKDTTNFAIDYIKDKFKNLDKSIVRIDISLNSPDLLSVDRLSLESVIYELGAYHISKFSESKKLSLIKKVDDNKEQIDGSMNESKAIKLYAETFIEEPSRDDFIKMANDIIAEFKSDSKD